MPGTVLRRSPRFLHQDPITPEQKKTRPPRVTSSPLDSSATKTPNKCDQNATKSLKSRVSVKPSKETAKSAGNDLDLYVIEKRVTRGLVNSTCVKSQVDVCDLEEVCLNLSNKEGKGKAVVVVGGDRLKRCSGKIEKRVSHSSAKTTLNQVGKSRKRVKEDKGCAGDVEKRASCILDRSTVNQGRERDEKDKQCVGDIEKRASHSSNRSTVNQVDKGRRRDGKDKQCVGDAGKWASCSSDRSTVNEVAKGRKRDEKDKRCVEGIKKRASHILDRSTVTQVVKSRKGDENDMLCVGDIEKRVSRSLVQRTRNQVPKGRKRDVQDEQCAGSTTQSNSSLNETAKGRKASREAANKKAVLDEGNVKRDVESSRPCEKKRDEMECGPERAVGKEECMGKTLIGEKRKRSRVDKKSKIVLGWTQEQETALGRAYFTAKPTPQFWKKVARMVPGKSAHECFERIHSDHQTPPQPCTRSMSRIKPSSPTLSASKLLGDDNTKTKRLRSTKRNCLLAQKTVRQLLEKQQNVEKDHDADLFAVLEPMVSPCSLKFGTPILSGSPVSLSRLSSAHKKPLSRLSGSSSAVLVSPPVLKQVKNKFLHEKYIDQLHFREAKRKAESLRKKKGSRAADEKSMTNLETNSVKVAKDALMFEAQDAILKYRNLQSNMIDESFDVEDNSYQSNEDDCEDEL